MIGKIWWKIAEGELVQKVLESWLDWQGFGLWLEVMFEVMRMK